MTICLFGFNFCPFGLFFRFLSGDFPSCGHSSALKPYKSSHIVCDIEHADLGFRSGFADGSNKGGHRSLLMRKNMLDLGTDHGFEPIGLAGFFWHRLTLGLLAMNMGDKTVLFHESLVLFRAISRISPDAACRVALIKQIWQLRSIMSRSVGNQPFADQAMSAIR